MMDGDVILFNRQPSLHKLSIQAFYVRFPNKAIYAMTVFFSTSHRRKLMLDSMVNSLILQLFWRL